MLCGFFEHQRRVQCKVCGAAPKHHGHSPLVAMELLASSHCVQPDALSEVVKVYLPMKLKVFVDDITACLQGRNEELPETAEKVFQTMSMEVEEEGFE